MAITLDGATRRIILDTISVSAAEIWSAWVDWHVDNSQWPLAFYQTGGNELGDGLFIPPYFFLLNGWRVRPMEADQSLVIDGFLMVQGGGVPLVPTLGNYRVITKYVVPVQAQGIATSGTTGPSAEDIASAVVAALAIARTPVNVKQINDINVAGVGTEDNPWGPV